MVRVMFPESAIHRQAITISSKGSTKLIKFSTWRAFKELMIIETSISSESLDMTYDCEAMYTHPNTFNSNNTCVTQKLSNQLKKYLLWIADYNGHYNAIDGNCLTEYNTDEVFGTDTWRLYTSTQNAWTSCKYSPVNTFITGRFKNMFQLATVRFSYIKAPYLAQCHSEVLRGITS